MHGLTWIFIGKLPLHLDLSHSNVFSDVACDCVVEKSSGVYWTQKALHWQLLKCSKRKQDTSALVAVVPYCL